MGFLTGKRVLITGMLSNRSIAYGIAKAMQREGAALAFTYQGEGVKDRVLKLAVEFESELVFPCDVASDAEIEQLFKDLGVALGWTRRHRAFDRVRSARGARRRVSRRSHARGVPHRARGQLLQLRRACQGRAADDGRDGARRC